MFIEREEWIMAGGGDGYIYVYRYDTMEEIMSFKAHDDHHIRSLAASPTRTFLLSASDDHMIKIWDWKDSWKCMRTFLGHGNCVTQVMFDPNDSNSFASASLDHTIKVLFFPSYFNYYQVTKWFLSQSYLSLQCLTFEIYRCGIFTLRRAMPR